MSKQPFSPQAAWDMLLKEEKMLRRTVPRLKVSEPVVGILFVLLTIVCSIVPFYALLLSNYGDDPAQTIRQVSVLQDALQLLNISTGDTAGIYFFAGIPAVFVICFVIALVLWLFFLVPKRIKNDPLPADYLQALDRVIEKATQVEKLVRVKPRVVRWVFFGCCVNLVLMVVLVFVCVDSSHPDFSSALIYPFAAGGMHLGLSMLSFSLLRVTLLRSETDYPVCFDLERDAKRAYKDEEKRREQEKADREKETKIKEATELFHAEKYKEVHKLLSQVTDSKSGDVAVMKILSDAEMGKADDAAKQAYKLLWEAKDLGILDHRIRDAADVALAQIKPLMIAQCEEQMHKAYRAFLQNHPGNVIYECEPLAEYGHPDAIMLMLVSLVQSRNNPRRYPEWLELAKKAKRRGFSPMFEEIFEELIVKLEIAIRQNDEYEKERKNRVDSLPGSYYAPIPTWAEPSGWTDFRTGEPLYRVNGKIINANGEEVSAAWWE